MVTVQVGNKCVANMCFATIDALDKDGSGWYHSQADGATFFLSHQHKVFPLSNITETITECFVDTSKILKDRYGAMLNWKAVSMHLNGMWYDACRAGMNNEFFRVNETFDKLEDFVGQIGRNANAYAKCQVQGVYVFK